jgi:hypothetical protein
MLFINRRVSELWEEELGESKQRRIAELRAVERLHLVVDWVQVHPPQLERVHEMGVGGSLSGLPTYTVSCVE